MCFVRPNPDTPCVMWRTSVTSASFTASGVEGFVCCPAHAESYSRAKKKPQGKNSMTYIGCHTAQKGARAAVIGPWSEHSQRSWAKSEQRQMRRNGEKGRREKRKKERNKQTKQGTFPSPVQSAASQGCQWKSDVRNRREPRSARQCRRARFPNSGCCCCCRRGAALLALFVSVRGQRAAAAAITAARRYSATVFSFSLTPLCPMVGGVGFSL